MRHLAGRVAGYRDHSESLTEHLQFLVLLSQDLAVTGWWIAPAALELVKAHFPAVAVHQSAPRAACTKSLQALSQRLHLHRSHMTGTLSGGRHDRIQRYITRQAIIMRLFR
jgi:hypothetical protein